MPTVRRGTIKSYASATHKATVQIAGSLAVWLDGVPVATNIPAADVVAGRECSVLFFDDSNPGNAVVLNVHGAVTAGVLSDPAGTARITLSATSPHVKLSGATHIVPAAAGAGAFSLGPNPPVSTVYARIALDQPTTIASGNFTMLQIATGSWLPTLNGSNQKATALEGTFGAEGAGTVAQITGLEYGAGRSGALGVQHLTAVHARISSLAPGTGPTTFAYLFRGSFSYGTTSKPTYVYGTYIPYLTRGLNRRGGYVEDPTLNMVAGDTAVGYQVIPFSEDAGEQWAFLYGDVGAGGQLFAVDRLGIVYLPTFTLLTRPLPGVAGRLLFVSDALPGQKFQGDDGAAWVPLG